jgi:hypothetical protein
VIPTEPVGRAKPQLATADPRLGDYQLTRPCRGLGAPARPRRRTNSSEVTQRPGISATGAAAAKRSAIFQLIRPVVTELTIGGTWPLASQSERSRWWTACQTIPRGRGTPTRALMPWRH